MSRVQLALNVDDLDESVAFYSQAVRHRAGQGPARLRQLRGRRAAAQAGAASRTPARAARLNHLGVEVADTDTVDAEQTRLAEAGLASVDERGHHLLLRQAGQVLGPGRAQRRALGDLHRPGRQPDLLRQPHRRSAGLLRRKRRP